MCLAVFTAAIWLLVSVFVVFVTCTEWRLYVLYTYQMNEIVCDEVKERFGNDGLVNMAYIEKEYIE